MTGEIMDITGGILMYGDIFNKPIRRYNNGQSPQGRKVIFLNKNAYDYERQRASSLFRKGQILTVKEIYVYSSVSEVEFLEYPGKRFNTAMFADVV